MTLLIAFTLFTLAVFLGLELISKVPATLHTPLMSGSNAISGITLIGALVSAGADHSTLTTVLGFFVCDVEGTFQLPLYKKTAASKTTSN